MYTLDIQDKNIFDPYDLHKIHCIGKCTKGYGPENYESRYFLVYKDKKYLANEILHTVNDIRLTLKEVSNFEVPDDFLCYKFTGIMRDGLKKQIIENVGEMAYYKNGFAMFKQMYYQGNGALMGGIDDIYEYEPITVQEMKDLIKEKEKKLDKNETINLAHDKEER